MQAPTSFAAFFISALVISAGAQPLIADLKVLPGELTTNEAGQSIAEDFEMPADLQAAWSRLAVGERLEVAAFPVSPGERAPLVFERVDLLAPAAKIFVVEGGQKPREIARSSRVQLLGRSASDPHLRVGLTVDPDGSGLRGLVLGAAGAFDLRNADSGRYRLADAALPTDGVQLESQCGADSVPLSFDVLRRATNNPPATRVSGTPSFSAVIAVDTDNEFNHKKFANNQVSALAWIADLFVQMNVMYERDLALLLVQGDTFLRLDVDNPPTYNDDPWTVTTSGANINHLNEFGTWWSNNQGGIDRVLAMLLSGKSSNGNSSSGIAWVNSYCETQNSGGGYSVTQVFWNNVAIINDVRVIAHELGHNFGSPHTHCYSPPIDNCWNSEAGCYAGATSCPGGSGTIMSYCHLNGCGSNQVVFHQRSIDLISGLIAVNFPGCIDQANPPIFVDGFEAGNTSAWSAVSP